MKLAFAWGLLAFEAYLAYAWLVMGYEGAGNVFTFVAYLDLLAAVLFLLVFLMRKPGDSGDAKPAPLAAVRICTRIGITVGVVWFGHTGVATAYFIGFVVPAIIRAAAKDYAEREQEKAGLTE